MSSKVLLVLACVLFFGVSGCADLPDVAALAGSVTDRAKTPDLIDTDGSVPNQRVCEILLANAAASSGMLQDHLPVAAAISTAPLVAGNRTTLLHEGRAIEQAVLSAIASATSSINIESYIIADDAAGHRFADLLIRKRAEHVAINIIYDGLASRGTSEAFFDRLRAVGIRLLAFKPINPFVARVAWAPNIRDHRKVFIVDGSIAIIGGANVELPSEAHDGNWRDTDVRIEGPAVAQLQKLFMQTWTAQGGGPLEHADYFPKLRRAGNEIIRVPGNDGGRDGKSPIYSSL